jgi:cobalt-zinc-cadmium efflux system outer membrane protein
MGVRGIRARAAGIAFLALVAGCAADTSRDVEAFDPRRSSAELELPPSVEADETTRAHVEDAGRRISQGLTLEEAERIALEVNPTITAAAEVVNGAKANVWQQSLFTNPTFSFGKAEIPTKGFNPSGSGPTPLTSDNGSRSFSAWDFRASATPFTLQKDFDVSGKRVARVDNAIEGERQTEAQFASAARQLKAQVRTAYAAILVAEKGLELAQEAFDMARKNVEILGNGAMGGKVLEGDSTAAESAEDRARIDLKQAELNLQNARIGFATLLGCPQATVGPLRGTLPLEKLAEDMDAAATVKEALQRNADVIAAKRAVLAALANVRLQKRSTIPDITVQATYNRYILDDFDTVGFNLSLPLPVFDQNRAQIAAAVANLHQAEAQDRSTELAVEQGVRSDLAQIATSRARIDAFEKVILPKARRSVTLTEESYQAGKVLYLNVIAARQNFNQQRQDYATELLAYETAMADLERLLGRSLEAKAP